MKASSSFLICTVFSLLLGSCQKDEVDVEFDTFKLPVSGKVRCIEPFGDSLILAGGDVDSKGFVVLTDKNFTYFDVKTASLSREVYDVKYINGTWWLAHDSLGLTYSSNLDDFHTYWWKQDDWVSDLSKHPIRRMEQIGKEHFMVAGGRLAFGTAYHSSDSANSWSTFEFEHETRALAVAGDASNWSAWVGGDGILIKKSTGDANWSQIEIKGLFISELYFKDLKAGWMVTYEGDISKTTDGGNNWGMVCKSRKFRGANRLVSDGSNWVVAANNGAFAHSSNGKDWRWYSFGDGLDLTDVFIEGDRCFISAQGQSIHRFSLSSLKD